MSLLNKMYFPTAFGRKISKGRGLGVLVLNSLLGCVWGYLGGRKRPRLWRLTKAGMEHHMRGFWVVRGSRIKQRGKKPACPAKEEWLALLSMYCVLEIHICSFTSSSQQCSLIGVLISSWWLEKGRLREMNPSELTQLLSGQAKIQILGFLALKCFQWYQPMFQQEMLKWSN